MSLVPRPKFSASFRALVWNTYIGEERGTFKCMCGSTVSQLNFECGHVISRALGGSNTLENLRPVCGRCNKSMGTTSLFDHLNSLGLRSENLYSKSHDIMASPGSKGAFFRKPPEVKKRQIATRRQIIWPVIKSAGRVVVWTLGKGWRLAKFVLSMIRR